jgi:hypothetical protein
MKCYGSGYHNVHSILRYLGKCGLPLAQILVVPNGTPIPERTKKKVLIFLNKNSLGQNRKTLNTKAYNKRQIILLEDPLTLTQYDNITLLDCCRSKELLDTLITRKRLSGFKAEDCVGAFPTHRKEETLTSILIAKVQERGSILNAFMSLVYTMPSTTHQKPVKTGICHWMFYGGKADQLPKVLSIINRQAPLSDSVKQRMILILLGDIGERYSKAFTLVQSQRAKKMEVDYDQLAADHSTSAYDMRYMRAIVSNYEKLQNSERIIGLEILKLLKVPKTLQLHLEPK